MRELRKTQTIIKRERHDMKTRFISIAVAAGVLLATTSTVWARPPRTHSLRGVVESIDCASQTIALKSKDGTTPLTFVWNDSTRFTRKGGCARCSLDSGQTVRVSYS